MCVWCVVAAVAPLHVFISCTSFPIFATACGEMTVARQKSEQQRPNTRDGRRCHHQKETINICKTAISKIYVSFELPSRHSAACFCQTCKMAICASEGIVCFVSVHVRAQRNRGKRNLPTNTIAVIHRKFARLHPPHGYFIGSTLVELIRGTCVCVYVLCG